MAPCLTPPQTDQRGAGPQAARGVWTADGLSDTGAAVGVSLPSMSH